MWANPRAAAAVQGYGASAPMLDEIALADDFDDFYEEVFEEVSKFGKIEELNIAGNIGDHLVGNVYIKFEEEEDAQSALTSLGGRSVSCINSRYSWLCLIYFILDTLQGDSSSSSILP
jgi:splicing factor U2AF subunit